MAKISDFAVYKKKKRIFHDAYVIAHDTLFTFLVIIKIIILLIDYMYM